LYVFSFSQILVVYTHKSRENIYWCAVYTFDKLFRIPKDVGFPLKINQWKEYE